MIASAPMDLPSMIFVSSFFQSVYDLVFPISSDPELYYLITCEEKNILWFALNLLFDSFTIVTSSFCYEKL